SCSDAFEAGATTDLTADYTFAAPYGNNGLANSVETVAESGIVNYSATYYNATNEGIESCIDSDNDGVRDVTDLDDDNDGVLDAVECTVVSPQVMTGTGVNKNTLQWVVWEDASISNGIQNGDVQTTVLPDGTTVTITFSNVVGASGVPSFISNDFSQVFGSQLGTLYNPSSSKDRILYNVTPAGSTAALRMTLSATRGGLPVAVPRIIIGDAETSALSGEYTQFTTNGTPFTAYESTGTFVLSGENTQTVRYTTTVNGTRLFSTNNATLIDYTLLTQGGSGFALAFDLTSLNGCDSDNDGIPNRLDTDSDDDGCSDAAEAGATTDLTANFTFSGPFGANGLQNSLETSAESGAVNYSSTYADYAVDEDDNACLDTDGDGVKDIVDIDDDNDGIVDWEEKIDCEPRNVTEIFCNDLTDYRWVNFTSVTPNTTATGTVTLSNGEVVNVTYTGSALSLQPTGNAMESSAEYCPAIPSGNQMIQTQSGAGLTHKFVFSKPIMNPAFNVWSLGNPSNYITYTFTAPVKVLIGNGSLVQTSANSVTGNEGDGTIVFSGLISEISFTASGFENWSGLQVAFGRAATSIYDDLCDGTQDTDGDGIPNHLDLDSDGDGCSDAYEGGATTSTTANYSFPGPYGTNGLANSVETTAESGVVNYTLKYNVANSAGLDACLDSDGDGVADYLDTDDDNDGVPDSTEQNCELVSNGTFTQANGAPQNWTTTGVVLAFSNVLAFNGSDLTPNGVASQTITVLPNYAHTVTYLQSVTGLGAGSSGLRVDILENNQVIASRTQMLSGGQPSQNISLSFLPTTSSVVIRITDVSTATLSIDAILDNISVKMCDSDGDGIPNHLDLDSDGDGCSDAFESGATGNLATDYTFPGPHGTNGLANSVETVADNGILNYTSSYSDATDPLAGSCVDTDGDGVADVRDLDDDNDGVPDNVENGITLSPACATVPGPIQFTVPAGVTQLPVKLWGAGGGGNNSGFLQEKGGSGAFVKGTIPVTPGEVLTLVVGEAGKWKSTATTYGGGGAGGSDPFEARHGGSGGGMSAIYRGTTPLLVAGGGGGAPAANASSVASNGGGGGAPNGQDGTPNAVELNGFGKGGTLTAGGAGGTSSVAGFNGTAGTQFQGGNGGNSSQINAGAGGGGGGGYYGGGGGSGYGFGFNFQESAGGGGSSYADPSVLNVSMIAGSTTGVAPNSSDPNYASNIGFGGAPAQNGGCGYINIDPIYLNDTDGDGIPNSLDPDSDGDGCSDALEAGATTDPTENYAFSGPFGTNGLQNSLETGTETGVVNYTSTYANATNPSVNACSDTDGDGIADYLDTDDDNDGVPDCTEGFTGPLDMNSPTMISNRDIEGTGYISFSGSQPTTANQLNPPAGDANGNLGMTVQSGVGNVTSYRMDFNHPVTVKMRNNTAIVSGFVTLDEYFVVSTGGAPIQVSNPSNELDLWNGSAWVNMPATYSAATVRWKSKATLNPGTGNFRFTFPQTNFVSIHYYNNTSTTANGSTLNWSVECADIDTDGDGIPNREELDSDNDGCSDAFESGATSSLTYNYAFPGPYGANGLANSVETGSETGAVNYSSTYANATNPGTAACSDNDNDGVPDAQDEDDDNDGVPDVIEISSCGDRTFDNNIELGVSGFTECVPSVDGPGINFFGTNIPPYQGSKYIGFHQSEIFSIDLGSSPMVAGEPYTVNIATAIAGINAWPGNNPGRVIMYASNGCALTQLIDTTTVRPNQAAGWLFESFEFVPNNNYTKLVFVANAPNYNSALSLGSNLSAGNVGYLILDNISYGEVCDTDGDGIPNHLDLDSDDDGCSDAYEAGATTNTAEDYQVLGPYGSNGLANSLETSSESGTVNYNSTYNTNATNSQIANCFDSDNDGETNAEEQANGTDPFDPCSFTNPPTSNSAAWNTWALLDCDGDGSINAVDPSPLNPCIFQAGAIPNPTNSIWAAADCDGDGETNGEENTNGTDSNDPCSYTNPPTTSDPVYAVWAALDCDGDGTPNGSDTDPLNPCVPATGTPNVNNSIWAAADCDGDGETNGEEADNGTDSNDPCSFTNAPTVSDPGYSVWAALDCDGDGAPNGVDPDPTDACVYPAGSTPDPTNAAWATSDCDGDGENNGMEYTNGTDPEDPCSYTNAPVAGTTAWFMWAVLDCDGDGAPNNTDPSPLNPCVPVTSNPNVNNSIWAAADCDGDGETNGEENTNGTDLNDPCSYTNPPTASDPVYAVWAALDCDGDGTPNGSDTDPLNPCVPATGTPNVSNAIWAAADCDGDGETNGEEADNGTDPNDPCSFTNAPAVSDPGYAVWAALDCDGDGAPNGVDPDPTDACVYPAGSTPDPTNAAWATSDCDGDGENNGMEYTNGTDPEDPCSYTNAPMVGTTAWFMWAVLDCDGDGAPNNTDPSPLDPCVPVTSNPNVNNAIWAAADCDGDGETNGEEAANGTDPIDPCSYTVTPTIADPIYTTWSTLDCDGDGVSNGTEIDPDGDGVAGPNGTDPSDACSMNFADVNMVATSTGDCDGDGVSNADEVNSTGPNDPQTDPLDGCSF
ncbi:MAG: glycine-rich protein, partial [Chitinophagales bacterium]